MGKQRTYLKKIALMLVVIILSGCFETLSVNAETAVLDAPTGLTATITAEEEVTLSWNQVAGATRYLVYCNVSDGYKEASDVAGTTSLLTAKKGFQYYFKVKAYNYNTGVESEYSSEVSVISGAPTYTIAPINKQTMAPKKEGYIGGSQEVKTINITKTGTGILQNLSVALDGEGADNFIITQPTITELGATTPNTSFTVKAKDGLTVGNYKGKVTVSATNMTNTTFDITQVINTSSTPVITAHTAPSVLEDEQDVALADDIQVTDSDGDSQTVTINVTGGIVTLGTTGITFGGVGNHSANFTASGSLADINTALDAATFTPTNNLSGTGVASISFKANDGAADSNLAAVTFNITPVNDAPSFIKGADRTVAQNAGAQTLNNFITNINDGDTEAEQTLSFNVSNNNPTLFTVQLAINQAGELSFTPNPTKEGSATITVYLKDDGGTANGGVDSSASQTFVITVTKPAAKVNSVSVPTNKTYITGENLDFTVNFDRPIMVSTVGGTPYISIILNSGGSVNASYLSGSGTTALVFRYTVVSGNNDNDGISMNNQIFLNGSTITDGQGNVAILTLNNIGSTNSVIVNTNGSSSSGKHSGGSSSAVKQTDTVKQKETQSKSEAQKSLEIVKKDGAEKVKSLKDVKESSWFYEGTVNAIGNGWFAGTTVTTFSPNNPMTREMFRTVLGRMGGDANDLMDNNRLKENITKEQLVTLLYRMAQKKGVVKTGGQDTQNISAFADGAQVSSWSKEAMAWANAQGIIKGNNRNMLNPNSVTSRAEVAVMLMRFDTIIRNH
ncbi:S-layer homology domain-containing protein [Aminipila sp.]|uniref:S-layer homology domain-containing protein n=1 Tax=Aminipila sp. TaxID=2060095 RepID=UPI0028A13557|nr:S-layer homology domain-containing protein [Aminipila sp.]